MAQPFSIPNPRLEAEIIQDKPRAWISPMLHPGESLLCLCYCDEGEGGA